MFLFFFPQLLFQLNWALLLVKIKHTRSRIRFFKRNNSKTIFKNFKKENPNKETDWAVDARFIL